jgi:hypothetical protein
VAIHPEASMKLAFALACLAVCLLFAGSLHL